MKHNKETSYSVNYYDKDGDWCDGDAEYQNVLSATCVADAGLRGNSSRAYAVVARVVTTKLHRVVLARVLEEV